MGRGQIIGKSDRRWIAAAVLMGLALRAAFVVWQPFVVGDSLVYGDIATNLLRHHVFGFTQGAGVRPTLIRLPGYPLFVAACFAVFGVGNYTAVLWLQVFADLLTCCVIAATAYRIAGRRAGFAALWLAALCPFTANYTAAAWTETFVLLTISVAFYSLCRWLALQRAALSAKRWVACLGVALAGSVLLRPDQGLLAAAIVAVILWLGLRSESQQRRRSFAAAMMVCMMVALPLCLWAVRNARTFHVFQPLAPRYANDPGEMVDYGFQRWYRTWAAEFDSTDAVYWPYDDSPLTMSSLPARACDDAAQCAQTSAAFALHNGSPVPTPTIDAAFASLAAQRIRAHPLRYYVEMPLLRLIDMLLRPRMEAWNVPIRWWQWRMHPTQTVLEAAYALLNLMYLAAAAWGLLRWKRAGWLEMQPLAAAMTLFVLLRCALLLTIDNSETRYTLEFFPLLLVWAAMLWRAPSQQLSD